MRTIPVRFGCFDDVANQNLVNENQGHNHLTEMARDQGRFNFATPVFQFVALAPYEVRQPWLFSLVRAGAFYLQVSLLAVLVARLLDNTAAGAAVAFFASGTLHLPLTFFPVLSFPNFWGGGIAVTGALLCHQAYVRRPQVWSGCLTGILFLTACLLQDFYVIFAPVFVALSWSGSRPGLPGLLRPNLGPLLAASAYLVVYGGFARTYPSAYAGTQPSFDFLAVGKILLRQMAGVMPGFELVINRPPVQTTGPLFRPLAEIGVTLAQTPPSGLLLGLVQAFGFTWLLGRCLARPSTGARFWPWSLVFALFVNLPVAFSLKYQTFLFHREYPYLYAFYSFLGLGIAIVGAAACFGPRLAAHPGRRRYLLGACGAAATLACLSAQSSNERIIRLLLEKFN